MKDNIYYREMCSNKRFADKLENIDTSNLDEIQGAIKEIIIDYQLEYDIDITSKELLSCFMDPIYYSISSISTQIPVTSNSESKDFSKFKIDNINFGKNNGTGAISLKLKNYNDDYIRISSLDYRFMLLLEHYFISFHNTINDDDKVDEIFIPIESLESLFKDNYDRNVMKKKITETIEKMNSITISWDFRDVKIIKEKQGDKSKQIDKRYVSITSLYNFRNARKNGIPYVVETLKGILVTFNDLWELRYRLGQIFNYVPKELLTYNTSALSISRYMLYSIKIKKIRSTTKSKKSEKSQHINHTFKMSSIMKQTFNFDKPGNQKTKCIYEEIMRSNNKLELSKKFMNDILTVVSTLKSSTVIDDANIKIYNTIIPIFKKNGTIRNTDDILLECTAILKSKSKIDITKLCSNFEALRWYNETKDKYVKDNKKLYSNIERVINKLDINKDTSELQENFRKRLFEDINKQGSCKPLYQVMMKDILELNIEHKEFKK